MSSSSTTDSLVFCQEETKEGTPLVTPLTSLPGLQEPPGTYSFPNRCEENGYFLLGTS